jgi:hypothetical protein
MTDTPRTRISERDLRDKFNNNEGGYPSKIATLLKRTVYNELASPKSLQVPETRSIVDRYYNQAGQLVMTLHYFLKPDGTLGGSGKWTRRNYSLETQCISSERRPIMEALQSSNSAKTWSNSAQWPVTFACAGLRAQEKRHVR